MDKLETLRHYFGHEGFRPGQEALVDALLQGKDCLGIMPTGAGKSMCYQIPALMRPGIALVISPLISLMKDQVAALKSAGVPAAYLNSSLTPRQMDLAIERARMGAYRVIYVAPERLETAAFRAFARQSPLSLLAVDEAHCVSQWGQDFRPDYRKIADFVDSLPQRPPVGAFTATATDRVREDIIRLLRLKAPVLSATGFDRPNLYFEVLRPKHRDEALRVILDAKRSESGIIYCATRKAVEDVCEQLRAEGFAAGRYHAGLSDEERRQCQEDFQYDRLQVMVATNAFGMGIDKSNVRYVIHYNMPRSMEAYYQEAGRAGRDGEKAECILLYSKQDIITAKWMLNNAAPNPDMTPAEQQAVRRQDFQRLNAMIDYCEKDGCLRQFILRYFGEAAREHCQDCSGCLGPRYREALGEEKKKARRPRLPVDSADMACDQLQPVRLKLPAPGSDSLFEQLRACRMRLAQQYRVPPYIICDDKTLTDLVRRKPRTHEGLMTVHGLGAVKVGRYGDAFLQVIRAYDREQKTVDVQQSPPSSWTEADKARARQDFLDGVTVVQIAKKLRHSPEEVRAQLRLMGFVV